MTISYEEAKAIAHDGDDTAREELANRDDIAPELLYYLAEDELAAVRRAVAMNSATPMHADLLLARDGDDGVRAALAGKIAEWAAMGGPQESTRLRDMANEALMLLAMANSISASFAMSRSRVLSCGPPIAAHSAILPARAARTPSSPSRAKSRSACIGVAEFMATARRTAANSSSAR